jgi:hypothetical protein
VTNDVARRSVVVSRPSLHRLGGAFALLILGLLGLAAIDASAGQQRPPRMVVAANGDKVEGAQGSYCFGGGCADYAYPLAVHGKLEVSGGDRVTLRAHTRKVGKATVSLLRVHGDQIDDLGDPLRARPVAGHPRRLRVRLPNDLQGANRLDIFVRYEPAGDSDFWAAIRGD